MSFHDNNSLGSQVRRSGGFNIIARYLPTIHLLLMTNIRDIPGIYYIIQDRIKEDGKKLLISAVQKGLAGVVKTLIKAGVNKHTKYKGLNTIMHIAIEYGHTEIVEILLDHGVGINTLNLFRITPLLNAIIYGHKDIIKILVEAGAEINVTSKYCFNKIICDKVKKIHPELDCAEGFTPLCWAISKQWIDIVKILLDSGADTEIKDKDGRTALHLAVSIENKQIIQMLLDAGANKETKNYWNNTPLDIAKKKGCKYKDIISMLS